MAEQAQWAHIRKIALPTTLGHRNDVVGIPQRLPAAVFESPLPEHLSPRSVIQLAHIASDFFRIHAALRANALIAIENMLAQIAGIRAKLPFVDADIATEGPSAFRNFRTAPPAERSSGLTALHLGQLHPSAGSCPCGFRRGFRRRHPPNLDSSSRPFSSNVAVASNIDPRGEPNLRSTSRTRPGSTTHSGHCTNSSSL